MTEETIYFELTPTEIVEAQKIIDNSGRTRVTLRKLFGEERWLAKGDRVVRQQYGERFIQSVLRGDQLNNIALHTSKTGANARLYDLHGGPLMIE